MFSNFRNRGIVLVLHLKRKKKQIMNKWLKNDGFDKSRQQELNTIVRFHDQCVSFWIHVSMTHLCLIIYCFLLSLQLFIHVLIWFLSLFISFPFRFAYFSNSEHTSGNLWFDPLKRKTRGEEAQERTRRIDQTKVAVTGGAPLYQHHPRGDSSTTPKKDGTRAPPNRGKREENSTAQGEREGWGWGSGREGGREGGRQPLSLHPKNEGDKHQTHPKKVERKTAPPSRPPSSSKRRWSEIPPERGGGENSTTHKEERRRQHQPKRKREAKQSGCLSTSLRMVLFWAVRLGVVLLSHPSVVWNCFLTLGSHLSPGAASSLFQFGWWCFTLLGLLLPQVVVACSPPLGLALIPPVLLFGCWLSSPSPFRVVLDFPP